MHSSQSLSFQQWIYLSQIPSNNPLADNLAYGNNSVYSFGAIEIIKKIHKSPLKFSSTETHFYLSVDISEIIPSDFRNGYSWTLWEKDEFGDYTIELPTTTSTWFIDNVTGRIIFFHGNIPEGLDGSNLPAITYYRYIGGKGTTKPCDSISVVSVVGMQGSQGFQGNQGPQGFTGSIGLTGLQGFTGSQGTQGFQGATGDIGFQGPQGFQGNQGSQGNIGDTGIQGPQGFQGNQGFQGTIGNGFTWKGQWTSETSYSVYDVVGYSGSSYVAIQPNIASIPPNNPTEWNLMNQKGDQGTQGFTGVQGPQGYQGAVSITSFTKEMVLYHAAGIESTAIIMIWRANIVCSLVAVRGYKTDGGLITIDPLKNGVTSHVTTALNINTNDTWISETSILSPTYAIGDNISINMGITDTPPTQITVQLEFTT